MTAALILDIAIALLLAAGMVFAVAFNRKLDAARRDWASLEPAAAEFKAATDKVEAGIGRLKSSTAALAEEAERAQALVDDLRFLIERAESTASRLENGVRSHRSQEMAAPRNATKPRPNGEPNADLSPPPAPAPAPAPKTAASGGTPSRQARPAAAKPEARSQAERALLEALRASE